MCSYRVYLGPVRDIVQPSANYTMLYFGLDILASLVALCWLLCRGLVGGLWGVELLGSGELSERELSLTILENGRPEEG